MILTGIMTMGWGALLLALYCQWINKIPILKELIIINVIVLFVFYLIGTYALDIKFKELLSDETQIWDNKLTKFISYIYLAICVIIILWILVEGIDDWLCRTVLSVTNIPEKDEWFGLYICFRLAVIANATFCFVFRMETLWLLEQRKGKH